MEALFPFLRRLLVMGGNNTLETPYTEATSEFIHGVLPLHDAAVAVLDSVHAGLSEREQGDALRDLETVVRKVNGWV